VSSPTAAAALADVAARYLQLSMSRQPFEAALLGVAGFDARVPDVTSAGASAQRAEAVSLRSALAGIPLDVLDRRQRHSHRILERQLVDEIADVDAAWPEITVDAALTGPQALILSCVPKVQLRTGEQLRAYEQRCERLPQYLDAAVERLTAGAAADRTATRRGVLAACRQVDGYLSSHASDDPLVRAAADPAWTGRIAETVRTRVRPAFARYRQALLDTVLPVARDDDHVGLVHIPGGPGAYAAAIRRHTTTDLTPDDVHRIGHELVGELRAEVAELAARALGVTDPAAAFTHLRRDPDGRFASVKELVAVNQAALDRAQAVLPRAFGRLPRSPIRLATMDPLESDAATIGYYQPPRADDGADATYWLNVRAPGECTRYEYEALTFHEAVPGHHVQTAIAQELDGLPDFRRVGYIVAYCEGWALYAERLGDELGLYSGDESRLGMLSFALWRASRLVVDTGMHHLGWSRDRAVAYLRDNTGLTPANVDNEIDRYIGWPAQATGYMIGCREIQRIRARTEAQLGSAFELPRFHDVVLGDGPLPLDLLDDVVAEWAAGGPA
jgi:uncharacterized protein (DUF885 family)